MGNPVNLADPVEAAAESMRADKPTISEAMKSFAASLAATGATGDMTTAFTLSTVSVMTCARTVLRLTNSLVLPSPMEWAERNPQGEDETGSARIEALTRYKACHLLAVQCQQHEGAKISKLLGRSFLQVAGCWASGGALAATAEEELSRSLPPATVTAFLSNWASVISGTDEELTSLVWAADFKSALAERQAARVEEVRERRERMEAGEDEAQRLRAALASDEGKGPDEEERVVELASS